MDMAARRCMTAIPANDTAAESGTNSGHNSNYVAEEQEPSQANAQSPLQPIVHGETRPLQQYVVPAGKGGFSLSKEKLTTI